MTDEHDDIEIIKDFLAATNVRAMPVGAVTNEGGDRVLMIEVFGTIGGEEGEEAMTRFVVSKDVAMQIRANLDVTIENWGAW
jgi:hypothetical protein